jgi:hypothetical protein
MDNSDIRQNILLSVDDTKILSKLCLVDKLFYQILSNKTFWNLKCDKNNLPDISSRLNMQEVAYLLPKSWFIYYKKETRLLMCTNRVMEILEHPKIEDFNNVDYIDEDAFWLTIYMNDIYLPLILDVEGINLEEITALSDKHVICSSYNEVSDQSSGNCNFSIDDDKRYVIDVNYYYYNHHECVRYYLERENMRKVFYNMLSFGVIPRDDYNNNYVIL